LVGAGPGDPDLLTLKVYRLLGEADVVLYDALISEEILNLIPKGVLKISVGKRAGNHSKTQSEINRLLERYARLYPKVVRLKGGDPLIFGRGGEEILYLTERGIEVEVVPAVSSFNAACANALVPPTMRDIASSFTVVSGHHPAKLDWENLVRSETLIFLMGVRHRQTIAEKLIEFGKPPSTGVLIASKVSTDGEEFIFTTLEELAKNSLEVETPALLMVGDVVSSFAGKSLNIPAPIGEIRCKTHL